MKNLAVLITFIIILLSISLPACSPGRQIAEQPDQKYVVVVVIDACRPDYFEIADVPNIKRLAEGGVSYTNAWVGQNPNVTPPSHATITTGSFPRHHGVLNFLWRNAKTGLAYWYTYWDDVYTGDYNKMIKNNDVVSIGSLYKQKFPGAKVASVGSGKFYAVASMAADDSDYIVFLNAAGVVNPEAESPDKLEVSGVKGHLPPAELMQDPALNRPKGSGWDADNWATDVALKLFEKERPQVLYINLSETDEAGHWSLSINDPVKMGSCVSNADRQIGRLMEAYTGAGIFDRTIWVVVADHGMTPTLHTISQKAVDAEIVKTGTKVQVQNPETLLFDPSKTTEAVENIVRASIPGIKGAYIHVQKPDGSWTTELSPSSQGLITGDLDKCFRYLKSTDTGPCSADFTLIEKENWRQDWSILGAKPMLSSHETITWNDQHVPLIICGPGVKKGVSLDTPARLVDIAPTIVTLLGIEPQKMDGVALADSLEQATPQQIKTQSKVTQFLEPLRAALKASSQADLAENEKKFGIKER